MHSSFSKADLFQLERAGISPSEAGRQLKMLREGLSPLHLDRPCRVGDGIRVLSAEAQEIAIEHYASAAEAGRFSKFVPASGAASRMFKDLLGYLERPERWAREGGLGGNVRGAVPESVREFLQHIPQFPFADALFEMLAKHRISMEPPMKPTSARTVLEVLLKPRGMGLAALPKALIPFHHYPEGSRTALEDHLVESAALLRDGDGKSRVHLTVSGAHRSRLEAFLGKALASLEASLETSFDITISEQFSSTDTLALDENGEPFRLGDGRLLLRPGGHGALLSNLESCDGDFVLIKNIDNIFYQPAPEAVYWMKVLGGELARIKGRVVRLLAQLSESSPPLFRRCEAATLLKDTFGVDTSAARKDEAELAFVRNQLRRPIRVCGVVPNQGQSGGGPFWVRHDARTVTRQIVEASQISSAQEHLMAEATHFNPVALACSLKDDRGKAIPLRDFVDPATAFIAKKSVEGRPLRALEHPGLWNGSMAEWNTSFVEIPASTFAPVKTVMDLLDSAHQGPRPLLAASGGGAE